MFREAYFLLGAIILKTQICVFVAKNDHFTASGVAIAYHGLWCGGAPSTLCRNRKLQSRGFFLIWLGRIMMQNSVF